MPPMKDKPADKTQEREIAIPDKLYFKIGEVAKIIGVKPYVLRYWETEFPDIAPGKTASKQRMYKRQEVETILKIRNLLYQEKFTIEGARKRMKEWARPVPVAEPAGQIHLPLPIATSARELLDEAKNKLAELAKIVEGL